MTAFWHKLNKLKSSLTSKPNGAIILGKMEYIIYSTITPASQLISQINQCMGFPTADGLTQTWMVSPDAICEFNLETGEKTQIGEGVIIKDEILSCLTDTQKQEIISLQGNINLCSWEPPIVSGETQNYFTQFFSGQTNN